MGHGAFQCHSPGGAAVCYEHREQVYAWTFTATKTKYEYKKININIIQ